ncbi:PAS domain-containing protein [Xanthomonas citri]
MTNPTATTGRPRTLAAFSNFVLDHNNLDLILNEGCRLIAAAMGTDLANVIEIARDQGEGAVRAGIGWRPGIVGHARVALAECSSSAYAFESGQPVVTTDVPNETHFTFPGFVLDHAATALVDMPILLPGRKPWGVLQVASRAARTFDADDIAFLSTFAMLLGLAIDRLLVSAAREQASLGSEERLGLAIEIGGLASWDWNLRSGEVVWSDKHFTMLGYAVDEVAPSLEAWLARVHPEDRDETLHSIQAARDQHTRYCHTFRLRWPNGTVHWCSARGRFFDDGLGQPARMIGVMEDITAHTLAQETLRKSEQRLELALEATGLALYEWDLVSDRVEANARYRAMVGLDPGQPAIGAHVMARCLHPDDRTRIDAALARAMDGTSTGKFSFEHRLVCVEPARTLWVLSHGQVYFDGPADHRRPARIFGLLQDITERKQADAALRESEVRHRYLIGSLAQAVWESDAHGVVTADSPSWRAYTGQSLEEWVGYGWLDAIHPDDRAYAERQWREAIEVRGLVDAEFRMRAPGGGWRWTNVRATPLLDADGQLEKWAGMNIDIHDRRLAEQALRESEERQALQLQLGDVLSSLTDAVQIQATAARFLAGQLDVGWCYFNEFDDGATHATVLADFRRDGLPSTVGAHDLSAERDFLELMRSGAMLRMPDLSVSEFFSTRAKATYSALGVRAALGVPLLRNGQLVAVLIAADTRVRQWSSSDEALLRGAAERTWTAIQRARIEAVQRETKERQAFLLALSDALRAHIDSDAIAAVAVTMLATHLQLDRCYIISMSAADSKGRVGPEFHRDTLPPMSGEHRDTDASELLRRMRAAALVIADIRQDATLAEDEQVNLLGLNIGALLAVPLRRGDSDIVWILSAATAAPRVWTTAEQRLVEEVAERTWAAVARARADAALQESESRFQQFANASAAGLWIRDAGSLEMEFASRAVAGIYGVAPGALLGDVKRWARLIVPEDRDAALGHLDTARAGGIAIHEFRIQRPSDGAFRWIRNTDFALGDKGQPARIGGIVEDITEQKLALDHQGVLLAELQHRVRNIMAILRAIAKRTAKTAESVDDYARLMVGRLDTFARVQALLTRAANASVGISDIVEDELRALAAHGDQFDTQGPMVQLSPKAAETMTLAVHELTTNALKYGALSVPNGKVTVHWECIERQGRTWLLFDWNESGAPPRHPTATPRRIGFGSELIEGRIPYELNGRGKVAIEPGGAQCHLEFPLQEGASILETGSPEPSLVLGGAIDMTGRSDLTGQRVLVVEDDYYLAADTARALQGAGADVIGPAATEQEARLEMARAAPTCAILDINLRGARSFALAGDFKRSGIAFVFLTGHDQDVIPEQFRTVTHLQKPVEFRRIVGALADAVVQKSGATP